MLRSIILSVAIVCGMVTSAVAQEPAEIAGLGSVPCSMVMDELKGGGEMTMTLYVTWAQGSMSGTNSAFAAIGTNARGSQLIFFQQQCRSPIRSHSWHSIAQNSPTRCFLMRLMISLAT